MAYFSNGTEGRAYYERYCARCVHDRNEDCPIWAAHLMLNPAGDDHILHTLIPLSKDGLSNEECRLFHPDSEYARGARADQLYFNWQQNKESAA